MDIDQETISQEDQQTINETVEERLRKLEILDAKDTTQACLAWAAMISVIVITGLLVSPFVPDSRIVALQNILDLYYVAQASVIGMYMGAKAWLARK